MLRVDRRASAGRQALAYGQRNLPGNTLRLALVLIIAHDEVGAASGPGSLENTVSPAPTMRGSIVYARRSTRVDDRPAPDQILAGLNRT